MIQLADLWQDFVNQLGAPSFTEAELRSIKRTFYSGAAVSLTVVQERPEYLREMLDEGMQYLLAGGMPPPIKTQRQVFRLCAHGYLWEGDSCYRVLCSPCAFATREIAEAKLADYSMLVTSIGYPQRLRNDNSFYVCVETLEVIDGPPRP